MNVKKHSIIHHSIVILCLAQENWSSGSAMHDNLLIRNRRIILKLSEPEHN